jgi:hypothetical protein
MANIFSIAFSREMNFKNILTSYGKESITTFYSDFTIAELVEGANGVKDTLKRVVKAWKNDVSYMAELVVVLNHKIWEHYETNEPLARVYDKLWRETDDFCREHFKGEDLSYYFNFID